MTFGFGQDFTLTFEPHLDEATIASIPAQTATLYIFDSKPSRSAAADGDGAVQTVTASWTASATTCAFAIDAIDDPDPNSLSEVHEYWYSVNFKLSTGEQTQTYIRYLELERVLGHDKQVSVTSTELTNIFPRATTYASGGEITAYITQAKAEVKVELQAKGYNWSLMYRVDRLNLAVSYKALMVLMRANILKAGKDFEIMYPIFKQEYETQRDLLRLEYDRDGDGKADKKESVSGFVLVTR